MKIKSIQITRMTEEIIKKYLYAGVYPQFKTITRELGEVLQEKTLGAPSFAHRRVHRKETTDPNEFNKLFLEIEQDLKDVYEATIFQYNASRKNHSKFEADRAAMLHEIESLREEIDELITSSKEADIKYLKEIIISFLNASNVDLHATTATVDSEYNEIRLKEKDEKSERLITFGEGASVEVYSQYYQSQTVDPVSNAFDDNINTRWWHRVRTTKTNIHSKMEIGLIIPFKEVQAINQINFNPHHSGEMYLSVEYSSDGNSYSPVKEFTKKKVSSEVSISFPKIKATHLKFLLTKFEYDDCFEDLYNYNFGARSIQIFKKEYEEESHFETKRISLAKNSKRVAFLIEDEKPPGTDIEYEVSIDNHEDGDIWYKISSMDKKDQTDSKTLMINPNRRDTITFNQCSYNEKMINGMKSYKLYTPNNKSYIHTETLDGKVIIEEIEDPKLYRGIHQIKREYLYVPFTGKTPFLSDWEQAESQKKNMIRRDYFNKRNEFAFADGIHNLYRFSFSVYSESNRSVPLSINSTFKILRNSILKAGLYSVYANKERLTVSNDEVTVAMKRGWTEIQILIHVGNTIDRKDYSEGEHRPRSIAIGKFNLGQEMMIRGDLEPLRFTDIDNLYHSISPHNKDYFSIVDREVFLNYDSKNTIFQLAFHQKKKTEVTSSVKIRARLTRGDTKGVTPKIKKIRIRTSE